MRFSLLNNIALESELDPKVILIDFWIQNQNRDNPTGVSGL